VTEPQVMVVPRAILVELTHAVYGDAKLYEVEVSRPYGNPSMSSLQFFMREPWGEPAPTRREAGAGRSGHAARCRGSGRPPGPAQARDPAGTEASRRHVTRIFNRLERMRYMVQLVRAPHGWQIRP
jgi:hypothetical protein